MLSLFKRQQNASILQQTLLDKSELINLQALAEQVDCSATPDQILNSRQAGNLPTRALGSGIDYAESRVYQAGDDPRSINWRLSARTQETFVKTYHIESRPSLNIFLDKRRSMVFGTKSRLKITQATRIATLLAYACQLHQLTFQAWILDDGLDNELGLQYFDDINGFLLQANKNTSHNSAPANKFSSEKASIHSALLEINQRTSKGSLIYLVSDFADLKASHQTELAHLIERCFVQALHIFDAAELSLPKLGKIRLQEMNQDSSKNYQLDTRNEKQQTSFAKMAQQHFEKKKSLISDLGISYIKIATDDESIQQSITLPLGQP